MYEYDSNILMLIFIIIIRVTTLYILYLFCKYFRVIYIRFHDMRNLESECIPITNVITDDSIYILVIQPDNNMNVGIQRN